MNLDNGAAEILITKQTGTTLHLPTKDTYVDTDIDFTIDVTEAVSAEGTAAVDVNVDPAAGTSGGTNIGDVVGTKTSAEPSSGYYIKTIADGSGNSVVTSAGWIDANNLPASTATETKYFSVNAADAEISGTNTVDPTVSFSGTNVTLNNENNGILITATGGGTSTASVAVTSTAAGYLPNNTVIDTDTIITTNTTSSSMYLAGVALTLPESGVRTFTITIPNGSGTVSLAFNVDPQGNITIN